MGLEEVLDVLLLVVLLVVFTPFTIKSALVLQNPEVFGFGSQQEKSLFDSYEVNVEKAVDLDTREILLRGYDLFGLVTVGDENQPISGEIRLPSGLYFVFDKEYRVNRQFFIRDMYAFFEGNSSYSVQDFYTIKREYHTGLASCVHHTEVVASDCANRKFRNWYIDKYDQTNPARKIPITETIVY